MAQKMFGKSKLQSQSDLYDEHQKEADRQLKITADHQAETDRQLEVAKLQVEETQRQAARKTAGPARAIDESIC
jgi:hypothetical protein